MASAESRRAEAAPAGPAILLVKGANPNYPFGPILPLPWEQKNLPDPSASP